LSSAPVLPRDFGAPEGMLLLTDYGALAPHSDERVGLGFGFPCLSEPSRPYDPEPIARPCRKCWKTEASLGHVARRAATGTKPADKCVQLTGYAGSWCAGRCAAQS
jgi:hypothetical protein